MKKITFIIMAAAVLVVSSCGFGTGQQIGTASGTTTNKTSASSGSTLGGVLSNMGTSGLGNVLTSVLGLDKVTLNQITGTWRYHQPGCAFTSQDLLAKAGGEMVASEVKQKLQGHFQTIGITSGNTYLTLNQDKTFSASVDGKKFSGNYTFDESNYKLTLSSLLLNINCYVKKNSDGIGILFEASKLLTLLQTMSAMSGNQTLQTIGTLSKSYDGLRIGFDMTK